MGKVVHKRIRIEGSWDSEDGHSTSWSAPICNTNEDSWAADAETTNDNLKVDCKKCLKKLKGKK